MRKSYIAAAIAALLAGTAVSIYLGWYFGVVPSYLFRPLPGASSRSDAVAEAVTALQANDNEGLSRVSTASLDSLRKGHSVDVFDNVRMQQGPNEIFVYSDVLGQDGERYQIIFVVGVNRNILGRWVITSWHQSP